MKINRNPKLIRSLAAVVGGFAFITLETAAIAEAASTKSTCVDWISPRRWAS